MTAANRKKEAVLSPKLSEALRDCRKAFRSIAVFSGAVNILMLAGPFYMLQVYDRVLASRSVPTLIALTVFLAGAYAFQAALDVIRSRLVVRSAAQLDEQLDATVHDAVVRLAVTTRKNSDPHQPVRDLDLIRGFLTGAGPVAIVDLPWMPVFLAVCFLIHPWLGWIAVLAAVILVTITLLTERAGREPAKAVAESGGLRASFVEASRRNSESVIAMGMAPTLAQHWSRINGRYISLIGRQADMVSSYGSLTKVIRLFMQSVILGTGAYLVIQNQLTAGAMIAASIMMGRALAPVEIAIANWRSFIAARQSIRRLSAILAQIPDKSVTTVLPAPKHKLTVEQLTVAAPGTTTIILDDINFSAAAGEAIGIIGPSGVGKTSLVRAILGIWPTPRGGVRIDGASFDQWNAESLGRHIGFVSQSIELFNGTISENIARMTLEPNSEKVVAAGKAAGVHDMIVRMPDGYDTAIGEAGMALSAGQRQRVALARALYGNPFLLVLDEPNSNLDSEGENALLNAVMDAKQQNAIVIISAHRRSLLAVCDKLLVLANGSQKIFGPRDEVLRQLLGPPRTAQGGYLKVAAEAQGASR